MPGVSVLSAVGAGRPRKPTAIKALAGTLQKCRTNPYEPKGKPKKVPRAPEYLTERQRAEWKRLAKLINPMRITTKSDVYAFESMVVAYTLRRQAEESLYAHGNTSLVYAAKVRDGTVLKARPEVALIRESDKQLALWMSKFGLSPADRSRVMELSKSPKSNPLAEFAGPRPGA